MLDVVVNIHAFEGDGGNLAAAEAVFVVSNPESLWGPKLGVLVTQMILADAYLVRARRQLHNSSKYLLTLSPQIYRVYVVYSSSLVVTIAPAFFLVCEAGTFTSSRDKQLRLSHNLRSVRLHHCALPDPSGNCSDSRDHVHLVLRLLPRDECVVNRYVPPPLIPQHPHTYRSGCTTGLIAGRIIRSNRRVREFRMSGVGRTASRGSGVVDIIVQSAAVYSCALIVILIAMFTATVQPLVVLGVLPSLAVSSGVRVCTSFLLTVLDLCAVGCCVLGSHHSHAPFGRDFSRGPPGRLPRTAAAHGPSEGRHRLVDHSLERDYLERRRQMNTRKIPPPACPLAWAYFRLPRRS